MKRNTAVHAKLDTHRALLGALFLCIGATPGCSAETADAETNVARLPQLPEEIAAARRARGLGMGRALTAKEREQVLELLKMRGIRVTDAIFYADNAVVVERDVIFDGPTVLREGLSEKNKGYWFGPPGDPWHAYNLVSESRVVNVVWDGAGAPDWGWGFAFLDAVQQYQAETNVIFSFGSNADAMSTVHIVNVNWDNARGYIADTHNGGDIYDPSPIFFNLSFNGIFGDPDPCYVESTSQLPWDVKRRVARHELAHAIGFAHTQDPSTTWISHTAQSNYASIMHADACTNTQTTFSSDDLISINGVYYLPHL